MLFKYNEQDKNEGLRAYESFKDKHSFRKKWMWQKFIAKDFGCSKFRSCVFRYN